MKLQFHKKLNIVVIMLLVGLFGSGCDDKWDQHYEDSKEMLPEYNLYDYISSQDELSNFTELLITAGYDSILSASQSFTVWAPQNESLKDIDRQDADLARTIVENHIARGSITTSLITTKMVRLLNGKFMQIERDAENHFSFGTSLFTKENVRTKNGLVHQVESYIAYMPNIWEVLGENEELSFLKDYLYGLTERVFSPTQSVEIGVNDDGNPVYDSIFIAKNLFLQTKGALNHEDSVYTALLLKNDAWTQAYEKIAPFYKIPQIYGDTERADALTQQTIAQDLIFRGRVERPMEIDSLISTNRNIFHQPSYLFAGAEKIALSNGIGYILDDFPFIDVLSWYKEIRVEAESVLGRSNQNNDLFRRSGLGSGLDVSSDWYLLLEPSGTSNFARSNVTFSIPNTLSAKYKVYVVFVPASVEDPNNLAPTKATFQLTYVNNTTGRTQRLRITPDENETDVHDLTKMFVTEVDFPFANIIDAEYETVSVNLQVTSDVTIAEETSGNYSRTMRIDCVILEPVVE